ncbi:MAG TPA: hypothetical protein VF194_14705 [Ferrovibrio sp.]|jgi:hypothetical protein|uniref:hypothetical protein n=1 Tax=Ferrovibrio sp. TaxID=1917215 RepID=UPI002ED61DA3
MVLTPVSPPPDRRAVSLYLAEVDFRYNGRSIDDNARAVPPGKSSEGKRLTYRRTYNA